MIGGDNMNKKFNLQLFNEGGAGAPSTGGESAGVGEGTKVGSDNQQQIIYGKQETNPGEDTPPQEPNNPPKEKTLEDKKAEFEALIKGEYKDLFSERMQQVINKRFKEGKGLEERVSKMSPILDIMANRYGVQAGDIEGLQRALESDNAYWEAAADEAGLTVEQYMNMQKMKMQLNQMQQMKQQMEREQFANKQYEKWMDEAAQVQQTYPNFDFNSEFANEKFVSLLRSGVPMQHAYEVMHMEDIKNNLMTSTAQVVEKQVADNIKAKGQRPRENGMTTSNGIVVKSDVSKLTKEDRRTIAQRVARGEQITW